MYLRKGRRGSPCDWLRSRFFRSISSKAIFCTGFKFSSPNQTANKKHRARFFNSWGQFKGDPVFPARMSISREWPIETPEKHPTIPLFDPGVFFLPPDCWVNMSSCFLVLKSRKMCLTWQWYIVELSITRGCIRPTPILTPGIFSCTLVVEPTHDIVFWC